MGFVPGYCFSQAIGKLRRGLEAEFGKSAARVEAAARLAVRLRRIPANFTLESARAANQFRKFANCDFTPGADVNRFGLVVPLGGCGDRASCVSNEKEFTRGAPRAPDIDVRLPRVAGFDGLANQGRYGL